jgi:curli biogenesis system outer membrane secretion channel CsgG
MLLYLPVSPDIRKLDPRLFQEVVMRSAISPLLCIALLAGCTATESHQAVPPQAVSQRPPYHGPRQRMVLGKVENKTSYLRGIFSDGTDTLGLQAQQILKTHLTQSGRFLVMDRVNLDALGAEAKYAAQDQQITGASVLLTGAVIEFGRRDVGTEQLAGLVGKSRRQVAYAKVAVSVVDVRTSQVLYSAQGAGEYELSNQEVLGFGSTASHDATLNDKVLNLAMIEVVERLVDGLEQGRWGKPE